MPFEHKGRSHRRQTRILLVGAGAVGQVYGLCLQRGGANVSFLVRKKYQAEIAAGMTLYKVCGKRKRTPVSFSADAVYGSFDDLKAVAFDQVWLCISTPALQKALADKNSDISKVLRHLQGATLVVLQSGPRVAGMLDGIVPRRQICDGGIAMVSYQAPLVVGEVEEPGIAFWLPAPSPFDGNDAAEIVALLKAGGCPAKELEDARSTMAFGSATLMPTMVALEGAGWKVSEMRHGPWASLAARASTEARAVVSAKRGVPVPAVLNALGPFGLKSLAWVAPAFTPFDVDVYLKYHFSKVHDQTRLLIGHYISDGEEEGLPTEALRELRDKVLVRS